MLFGCANPPSSRLVVAAAVSLTEALEDIAPEYERATGSSVTFTGGASNTLARQIAAGAPADIFVSADEAQMEFAARAGAIDSATRVVVVSNELAVVAPADATAVPRSAADLAAPWVRRIAIGDPEAVPAGVYARQYFERLGLWALLAPKMVPTGSVRGALAAVTSGAADAAVVYRSDLMHAASVKLAFAVPKDSGPAIVYPAAVTRRSRNPEGARRFLSYLRGVEAQRVFARHGFRPHAESR